MRLTPTGTLDVSVTESVTNGVGVSETTSPSATSQKLSRPLRAGYTPPPSNASCRSQRSHAKLKGYALEKSLPSSLKTLTSCKSYVLVRDKLYRRGASSGVLMKCIPRQEGKDILEEIHKGVCGNHTSSRTLVRKAFRRAFYWPTALGDTEELVTRCQGCQYFAK
jgi:hypothetical protein